MNMRESEVLAKTKEWEAQGFKFIGNGSENNDDDPSLCPSCGRSHIFWALWEHTSQTRYAETDSEYNPLLLNSANQCIDCGYRWINEEKQITEPEHDYDIPSPREPGVFYGDEPDPDGVS